MHASHPLLLLSLLAVTACGGEGASASSDGHDGGPGEGSGASGGEASGGNAGGAVSGGDVATPGGAGGETGGPVGVPTWSDDIAPIMGLHCAGCHTAGAAAPFALDTYETAQLMAAPAAAAVMAGRMPPWQADPDCRHYEFERILPAEDAAKLIAWAENGAPEGTPGVVAHRPESILSGTLPKLVGHGTEPFTPDPERPDDYRCFPIDLEFPAETYVIGTNVVPGAKGIVHHVLVYIVPENVVPQMEMKDAAEDGPGYACFGGTGLGTAGPMAAWVPGYQPVLITGGAATVVPAGSRLVMQIHYNTLASPPVPDLTEFQAWTMETAPEFALVARPLANLGINIPAGEANSEQVKEITHNGRRPLTIVATGAHMHKLGRHIKVEALHADGESECLIDIPDWDFNWQQSYRFLPGEEIIVQPGEKFRLTCVYDNSPENQAVVNGEQLPPRDVTWGEGTADEMCLDFITVREPFVSGGAQCADFGVCRMECEAPDSLSCAVDCSQTDQGCATCIAQGVFGEGGCARTECLATLAGAGACLRTCVAEGITSGNAISACLKSTCPTEYGALETCMDTALSAGKCDTSLGTCDIMR